MSHRSVSEQSATPMSSEKRTALLQTWKKHLAAGSPAAMPLTHVSHEGLLPLSFAQERIWFLQQFMPDSSGYHLPIALHISGQVSLPLLEQSFTELLKRHVPLRTRFLEHEGRPVQVIMPPPAFTIATCDLRTFPEDERDKQLQQHIQEEYARPFDLTSGPLMRAFLFELTDQSAILLILLHHLITDGWSNVLIIKELGQIYGALAASQPISLPELIYQYPDLVHWQRQRWQEHALARQQTYWQELLGNAPFLLQLPLDHPRPAIQTSRGAIHRFLVAPRIQEELKSLSQQEGATFVMAVLALFTLLLWRLTRQDDILIGVPAFNRTRSEAENLVGLFVNTIVLRTTCSPQDNFRTLLRQVRQRMLEAYEHQEYPFEKLVEAIQPERDTSHSPLFQVMLSVSAGDDTEQMQWPGATVQVREVDPVAANFDLTLEVVEQAGLASFAFVYRTDLFEEDTIARLADHLSTLLEGCLAHPEMPIGRLPLLSSSEQEQMVNTWNATQMVFPSRHVLHQLVEEQCMRTPDAIAVLYEGTPLTYRQLNQRANQLAHFLRTQGVQAEQLVGIAMERSLELVIGLLGILKAGGAYVPLDPSYPAERLAYMIDDARLSLILTQQRLQPLLPASQVLCLDTAWPRIGLLPVDDPPAITQPEHLAYMIYTSGSTGRPKGALNTHRGVCNRLLWMQHEYQLQAEDRVLQKTPCSFDVSVWEFFWPLISGAGLVLACPEGHKDPAYIHEIIQQEKISTIHFVPSMLQVFLEEPGIECCSSLRRVICSGEALPYELQMRFFTRLPATQLHNLYGPTEAAIDVSYWACEQESQRQWVPIGRPVANTQLYILDPYFQPVPIGVAGELYIGGVQVGRGYWQRPELTAEKFLRNPFSSDSTALLYKTGDIARYHADGVIEYLGRIDDQIKIRGFRIELGEIESALLAYPPIREAVVLVREVTPGDRRLVGFFTANQNVGTHELRHFLSDRLPEYMVPGILLALDALPLTTNGKVDKRALSHFQGTYPQTERAFFAPENDIERRIAAIWQELLHLPQVGTQDNFFELGGHSLLVIQMRGKLREELALELSLVELFQYSTIKALAQHINREQAGRGRQASPQSAISRAELQRQAMKRQRAKRL